MNISSNKQDLKSTVTGLFCMAWMFAMVVFAVAFSGCKKSGVPEAKDLVVSVTVNGVDNGGLNYKDLNTIPVVLVEISEPVNEATISTAVSLSGVSGEVVAATSLLKNSGRTIEIKPLSKLEGFTIYNLAISTGLQSVTGGRLANPLNIKLNVGIDSSDKFPVITDSALLDLVQKQTFKYFWDFGHPVSGLARERNTSGDLVTSGGSGFGAMAIVAAINRKFITREEGLARLQKMLSFLKNTAQTFHGAYPHWLNGATGAVIPFSAKDNGADLVETSYLVQGLLTVRQYFNGNEGPEVNLRDDINFIWARVEWSWFKKANENVLYWHWSPNNGFDLNLQVTGWNECLITYVLAASAPVNPITKMVYDNGWARNGSMRNNNTYYGLTLPLGPDRGGSLFFSHYSFLGINPNGLQDQYANYQVQVVNHTRINYEYCKANPKLFYGYSSSCWGLTASDIPNGYTASSPSNDVGVIAPTAALSSFPYMPAESMDALKFFYYKLGNKIWKEYGFVDAFALKDPWFANSYLAIDQGPIIIMIENYRSKLLWNLFTGCPEIKSGMKNLGFSAPYL